MVEKNEVKSESIDVLVDYKLGKLNLYEASKKLSLSSGLTEKKAIEYIINFTRDNLVDLKKWRDIS